MRRPEGVLPPPTRVLGTVCPCGHQRFTDEVSELMESATGATSLNGILHKAKTQVHSCLFHSCPKYKPNWQVRGQGGGGQGREGRQEFWRRATQPVDLAV